MSQSRSFNAPNSAQGYQPIVCDAIVLSVETAKLVEKINKGFKFSLGEPTMKAAMAAGRCIKEACGSYTKLGRRIDCLTSAQSSLLSLEYCIDVALCANKVTAEEKAKFDIAFHKVDGQLKGFLSSLQQKVRNARQSFDGNASGEFSK